MVGENDKTTLGPEPQGRVLSAALVLDGHLTTAPGSWLGAAVASRTHLS
jgi:hypothetical protein